MPVSPPAILREADLLVPVRLELLGPGLGVRGPRETRRGARKPLNDGDGSVPVSVDVTVNRCRWARLVHVAMLGIGVRHWTSLPSNACGASRETRPNDRPRRRRGE